MSGYGDFSAFYDVLMTDVDYAARAEYLLRLFDRHGAKPRSILDIACGSGSLLAELQKHGVDTIGVDGSDAMLMRAREKLGSEALLLEQDMCELDLYGTVDGAVCTLDSLNHLCRTEQIAEVFRRARLFVEPNGLLIFDVNTIYKHREVLGDTAFVAEQAGLMCVWRNHYLPRTHEVSMLLDFFVEEADGSYTRYEDTVRERAYSERTLRCLLAETGWETMAVYGDMTTEAPTDTCERMVFVARNTRTVEQAQKGE
ncbi:MAG: class I SAM-dependent methyltransferase [Clostridia bacterium]|nr:class I SAM-dependent methyltransferase [Clostridia bacterium]